jgi:hypothetical protein
VDEDSASCYQRVRSIIFCFSCLPKLLTACFVLHCNSSQTFTLAGVTEKAFDDLEALSISLSERSKETFWLGADVIPRCKLEYLAKSVFLQCTSCITHKSSVDKSNQKGELNRESLGCEWWVQVKELRGSDSVNDDTIVVVGGDEVIHEHGHGHSHSHANSESSCCAGEGNSNNHPSPLGVSSSHSHSHSHDHGHSRSGIDGINLIENKNKGKGKKSAVSKIVGSSSEDVRRDHDLDLQGICHNFGHDDDDDDDDECSDIDAGGGIGLHYDKDEEVAEHFGVGVFPQISTVTYLSSTPAAAPTVVIENTPNETVGKDIKKCYVSYPIRGKHVRFDGRYLHGACPQFCVSAEEGSDTAEDLSEDVSSLNISNSALGKISKEKKNQKSSETLKNETSKKYRVTFLANIWYGHKPSKIEILPTSICDALLKIENELDQKSAHSNPIDAAPVCVFPKDLKAVPNTQICVLNVTKNTVEKEEHGSWQDIPFVTAESDWGKQEDETDLFLRIWTPSASYLRESKSKTGADVIVKNTGAGKKSKSADSAAKKVGIEREKKEDREKDIKKEKEKEREKVKETSGVAVSTFEINYTDKESAACLLYDDDGDSGLDSEGEGDGEGEGEGEGEEEAICIGRESSSGDRDDEQETWHDKASVRK